MFVCSVWSSKFLYIIYYISKLFKGNVHIRLSSTITLKMHWKIVSLEFMKNLMQNASELFWVFAKESASIHRHLCSIYQSVIKCTLSKPLFYVFRFQYTSLFNIDVYCSTLKYLFSTGSNFKIELHLPY